MSDLNESQWPTFLVDFLKGEGNSLLTVEPERKLCDNCDYLFFDNGKLQFHSAELGKMSFDFLEQFSYHQKCKYAISKEPLARALAIKGAGEKRKIWDATCGTGKDSLLIFYFGAELVAFERNPAIYLLLKDAMRLYPLDFQINFGDASKEAIDFNSSARPEVIYYDPMYPTKKKSALARKEMRIFKEIVGADEDSALFFEWAMKTATDRVVIKRPLEASFIVREPTASYKGKSTRYDMYKIL